MPSFTNLDDLQNYLEHTFANSLENSAEVERVLESAMRESVMEHVYGAYAPVEYERRGDKGGLSDVDNMTITDVSVSGGKVKILFENLTQGADNLQGEYTGDLIEFGEGYGGKHWDTQGAWSEPRPFSAKAADELRNNPEELKRAIKTNLEGRGFQFK